MVLHRALMARGWKWNWPVGQFPPPGMRPEDEWARCIPEDCAWLYPGSVEGQGEPGP
ncbi:hypothetical protein [Amycolatopsis alba]|uniref:hypothetical protein n=1 Tax=Amycolatopsis alba TaxID=76020 RepID=UPI0012FB163C|nr:hypothetical protein [Amycolatopsis alba]